MARKWCGMPLRISSCHREGPGRRGQLESVPVQPLSWGLPTPPPMAQRLSGLLCSDSLQCLKGSPHPVVDTENSKTAASRSPGAALSSRPVYTSLLLPLCQAGPPGTTSQLSDHTAPAACLPRSPGTPQPCHLEQLLLPAPPLFPLVGNTAPQDPRVLLEVAQVGGGRGAGHQRGATVPPRAIHGAHGLGVGFQEPGQEGPVVRWPQ